LAAQLGGCDKSNDNTAAGKDPTVLVIPNTDLNKDGSITDQGLAKVQAKSGEASLTVVFVRSPISDAGLNQLAKFSNVKRVEAFGSRVTPAGIQKLKGALPQVEVVN
jgi:hypothetical protein